MIAVEIKFVNGLQNVLAGRTLAAEFSDDATVADLDIYLRSAGIDLDGGGTIAVLGGLGLRQWPESRKLRPGDKVIVLPSISGG